MKTKFIIRFNIWCSFFVEGDITELQNKLNQFGCYFVCEEDCDEENLGVHFNKMIITAVKCMGRDERLEDKIIESIRLAVVKETNSDEFANRLIQGYNVRSDVRQFCSWLPTTTNLVNILVSDSEDFNQPNKIIIPRKYESIDSITEDDFWFCMREDLGCDKIEYEQ